METSHQAKASGAITFMGNNKCVTQTEAILVVKIHKIIRATALEPLACIF